MIDTYLGSFVKKFPPHKLSQKDCIDWTKNKHLEFSRGESLDLERFFRRFSVKDYQINERWISHPEIKNQENESTIFSLENFCDISYKSKFYQDHVKEIFRDFYPSKSIRADSNKIFSNFSLNRSEKF
ncbi:MAG: hypothetical protein AB8G05_00830 [Oligoflexales bacterium]